MLAKFSGISRATESSSVTTIATSNGARVSNTSASRRKVIHNRRAIAASAKIPASINARTTVFPASNNITAGPVAAGSIANTAHTKLRNTLVSSGSPFGRTWTRARPSGVTQSLLRSTGMVSGVTGWGSSSCRSWLSETRSGSTTATSTDLRTAGSDCASWRKSLARRRAASAPGPSAPLAAVVKVSAVDVSAAMFSWSVGGGDNSFGLIDVLRASAAS